jgi:predicted nucleic acid-binding protein
MLALRLVIDANVLILAAIKPVALQRTVLRLAITKPARFYGSRPLLEEYSEVLSPLSSASARASGSNCSNSSGTTVTPS